MSEPVDRTATPGVGERALRALLTGVGLLSVGLAFVGAVLPLIPTTPFVLLAAACFARSSPRFHAWLRGHPWFGPPLRTWREQRALPRRTKRLGLATLWITFPITIYLAPLTAIQIGLAILLLVATTVLARIPALPDTQAV